jgi:hypothetical protein
VFLGGAFLPQFFGKESGMLFFAVFVTLTLAMGLARLVSDVVTEVKKSPERSTLAVVFAFFFAASFPAAAIVFTWLLYAATK